MLQSPVLSRVGRRFVGLLFAASGTMLTARMLPSQCVPVVTHRDSLEDWSFHDELRGYAKFSPLVNELHVTFERSDTATIQPIRDNAICQRATTLLHAWLVDSAYWPVAIRMAYIGRYAFVWDIGSPDDHSEFKHHMFVFDRAVTHVLFPCRDGLGDCFSGPAPPTHR